MTRWRWALAGLAAAGAGTTVGRADSIWDRRDPRYAFLFQDNRARSIGDVLTVVVTETTVAAEQDARALSRTTSGSGSVTFFGTGTTTAGGTAGGTAGTPATGTVVNAPSETTARAFNGSATLNTNRTFTDRLAVTVVDMMPNGNLVIEGYRSRVVQGEERVLRVTGVVRQQDVAVGNLVQSGNVANFRVSYLGRGPATRFTKQGYVGRLVNLISPF
ncbi:MAG TPA: flagellar basal body L-ring protein FlgH [Urbifossiella sp.]|jgi:flagellar L-ring protein precursor FlgH|nr:flagellar basal body L-ring protein FlgH [Urbifossiella sp.]